MKKYIVFFTFCILMFSYLSAFGYSFHCEKYARSAHVQSCLREEDKYRRECNNNDDCMKKAHDILEKAWAKYNLPLVGGNSQQTRKPAYPSNPVQHMTAEEQFQRHLKNERERIASRSHDHVDDILFRHINSFPLSDPKGYNHRMLVENNYNSIMNCMKDIISKGIIPDNQYVTSNNISDNTLHRSISENDGLLLDVCIKQRFYN